MVKLPLVVQPKREPILELIGTEDSGQIQVERRGYLSTTEKTFVQQIQQADSGTSEIITVSRKVAREYALGMDKAYNLVLEIIAGLPGKTADDAEMIKRIELEFAEDLTNVVKGLSAQQAREDIVYAICMLRYRVNADFEIEDIGGVHPDLISGLAALYRDEEKRSIEAFQASNAAEGGEDVVVQQQSVEEAEKKPATGKSSRSKSTTGA